MRRTAAFTALWRALTTAHRGGPGMADRLLSVPRLAWASLVGRYDGAGRFLAMALATAYVVSPIDLVPELLLGPLGLIDDGLVVAWIAGSFLSETERFLQWERLGGAKRKPAHSQTTRDDVIDGQVVDG